MVTSSAAGEARAAIRVEGLRFAYPPLSSGATAPWVLDGLDLEVRAGEWLAVMGASDVGKTTLCLLLAGLAPSLTGGTLEGRVLVAGRDTQHHPPPALAALVGLVFQEVEAQVFNPSVEAEIAWGLENLGLPPAEIRARVDAIVKDPKTAAALKPYYPYGCKRPTFHDEFLPTFNQPHVTLVDTVPLGVREINARGVVHDGVRAYEAAGEALVRFREKGGTVVLLSNAPMPADAVARLLDDKALRRAAWDAIVTSGDITLDYVAVRGWKRVFKVEYDFDTSMFDSMPVDGVGVADAEAIVCAGMRDHLHETPEAYSQSPLQHPLFLRTSENKDKKKSVYGEQRVSDSCH